MNRDELAGFILTPDTAEQYFLRCMEAEKTMGPLSKSERIVILKSLGSPITMEELLDIMSEKRVLMVKEKKS